MELELDELKEWLRIDTDDDDNTLSSLISTSKYLIKKETGVIMSDVEADEEAIEMYKTLQKIIITDLYENRLGQSKISPLRISLSAHLQAFKNSQEVIP